MLLILCGKELDFFMIATRQR